MATKVVRRNADITPKEALAALAAKFPNAKVASFGVIEGGRAYEAKLVLGEFPPGAKDDDGGDAPVDDAPPAPEGDDDGDEGGAPDGPPKEKKDKGGESHAIAELTHLVKQVALAVGVPPEGPSGPGGETAPGGDPGMEAGPMAPPGGDVPPPLPPPAKPGGGAGGGGLGTPFSRVAAERRSFVIWREPDADGTLPSMKVAAAEVRATLPASHKLAKITMERAKIDGGEPVNVYVCAITAA
jgi:hypothetical protein